MSSAPFFQRLTTIVLAIVTLFPMSAFAETRRISETEFTQIAAQVLNTIMTARRPQTPSPAAETIRQSTSTPSAAIGANAILAAMNAERRQRGLAPLRLDTRLNEAAADRARDMADKHYFNHVAPDGTQPFVWIRKRSYRYSIAGENLAEGYRTAGDVVDSWMSSAGHRANILGRSFEDVGLAIVRGSPTRISNGYTVVALYAREAAARQSASLSRR